MLSAIDAWVISKLAADSMGYFKKQMSLAEIKAIYKASSTPHSKNGVEYSDTMRTKLNVEGPKAVKCWTPEKVSRALPLDWRGCILKPIVLVRGVWFMSGQCGITFETQHCTVEEEDDECPFYGKVTDLTHTTQQGRFGGARTLLETLLVLVSVCVCT